MTKDVTLPPGNWELGKKEKVKKSKSQKVENSSIVVYSRKDRKRHTGTYSIYYYTYILVHYMSCIIKRIRMCYSVYIVDMVST